VVDWAIGKGMLDWAKQKRVACTIAFRPKLACDVPAPIWRTTRMQGAPVINKIA
jgi:hypothetical protein